MSSGIASIRERLNNIRMQREMKQNENTAELNQDSTGNTGNTTGNPMACQFIRNKVHNKGVLVLMRISQTKCKSKS